jgi:8-oxo-dGTP pyrophosphatase MutT (NUDIX family)
MSAMPIAVALMRDSTNRVLLVRKRATAAFTQPGGKIENDEDARTALVRELCEELLISVSPQAVNFVGTAEAPAANEPGVTVKAEIFEFRIDGPVTAQAEIEETAWVDPSNPTDLILAPLTRDHILPLALTLP